ncbi:MAG: M24 family metallopeptidase, partial [Acidimicrobiaceae bacterium]|nr:M24 family metallopeptidase [Acidimicrobiaceae bacterium]
GDTSVTLMIGEVDEHSRRLVAETRVALHEGIGAVQAGAAVSDIGRAIQNHAWRHSLGVVREFIGHGVGTEFHSGLQVPHYYDRRHSTVLGEGMTFTIEPMLTLGSPEAAMWDDGWTAVTVDGRRTAQFEHTLACTADGAEILTRTPAGECAHDLFTEPVG